MRKDDYGRYARDSSLLLLIVTSLVLVFCSIRVWKQMRARQQYRPLQVFYVILVFFLICRFFYFLSPFCDYPDFIYYVFDIPPTVLINCVGGVVCYIWYSLPRREISIAFLPSMWGDVEKQRAASRLNFHLTVTLFSLCVGIFWASFLLLYFLNSQLMIIVSRCEDIVFCVITALFLYKRGHDVSHLIVNVMSMKAPLRLLVVRRISVLCLLIRAAVNIALLVVNEVRNPKERDDFVWAAIAFFFYFCLEDVPMLILVLLVHVQENEKERVRRETVVSQHEHNSALNPSEVLSSSEEALLEE